MKQRSANKRRGTILIAVLVCMGFATTILLGAVHTSLRLRRDVRQDLQMEQTKWLMDLGVRKAISDLRNQPDYDGETLTIAPPLAKYTDASVEITVDHENQPEDRVRLKVTARLNGAGPKQTSLTQRSIEIIADPSNRTKNP